MIMIYILIMIINMRITMMKINKKMKQLIMIINSFPVLGASQGVNDTFIPPYFAPKPRQGLVNIYNTFKWYPFTIKEIQVNQM